MHIQSTPQAEYRTQRRTTTIYLKRRRFDLTCIKKNTTVFSLLINILNFFICVVINFTFSITRESDSNKKHIRIRLSQAR